MQRKIIYFLILNFSYNSLKQLSLLSDRDFPLQDNEIFVTCMCVCVQIAYPLSLPPFSNVRTKLNEEFKLSR